VDYIIHPSINTCLHGIEAKREYKKKNKLTQEKKVTGKKESVETFENRRGMYTEIRNFAQCLFTALLELTV
jgi:hypothetical protein